jgi:putative hemolysin
VDIELALTLLFSLVASAFSSGMEIAFVSANKLKIELDRKQGVFASGIISYFAGVPKNFIAAMLIGNNVALVVFGLFMGDFLEAQIALAFPAYAIALGTFGLLITQTLITTAIVLVFGEFIPKAIVSHNPNRWLIIMAIPLAVWYVVMFSFAWIVTQIADFLIRLATGKKMNEGQPAFGRIDLDHYLEQATGQIDHNRAIDHEITIFQNALDFSRVKARDCMIPRNEIVALEITDSIDALKDLFVQTRLSKILVFRDNIDHIIGYVHSYELFNNPKEIRHIIRPVSIIPEAMQANELLGLFIRQKRNMAVVVDEFGGTAGIITMEDVVEEIFGEIDDEHDKDEFSGREVSPGIYELSARLEIDYLNKKFGLRLPEDDRQYDTLGGLFIHLKGDLPEANDSVSCETYVLTALKVAENRIEVVRVERGDG